MRRVIPIAALGLTLAGSAGAVTYFDGEFDLADWSVSVQFSNFASETTSQNAAGGNPGAYRFTVHNLVPDPGDVAIIFVFHEYTAQTFNPAIQGELVSYDNSFDRIEFNPPFAGAAVAYRPALVQNGVVYVGGYLAFTNLAWQPASFVGQVESDFTDLLSDPGFGGDGIFENPDFSMSGAPIRFGYVAANSGGGIISTEHGIDNWSVTLVTNPLPVILSPDITVDLAGTVVEDQQAAFDDGVSPVATLPLGALPVESSLTAYTRLSTSVHRFSLDTTTDLGSVIARPGDVVEYDGVTYSLEFDADSEGVPHGARVDALTMDGTDLLLSFDVTVDLPGSLVADDEDLVRFDGASFTLFLDGSAEGVPEVLDLDGADLRAVDGVLLLSFDASGSVAGLVFDDEDVLALDPTGPTWSLHYDGSAAHPALVAADVTAVPEPSLLLQLTAGVGLLSLLGRLRPTCRAGRSASGSSPAKSLE